MWQKVLVSFVSRFAKLLHSRANVQIVSGGAGLWCLAEQRCLSDLVSASDPNNNENNNYNNNPNQQ